MAEAAEEPAVAVAAVELVEREVVARVELVEREAVAPAELEAELVGAERV